MHKIVLDADLRAKLHDLAQQVEVQDENGNMVGYFVPRRVFRDLLVAWSEAVVPDDEVERRMAAPGEGKSLTEFWQSLKQPQ
jgi:hypothetical protein